MRIAMLLIIGTMGCVAEGANVGEISQPVVVECNEATVGQSCDSDDNACTLEQCEIIGPGVACVAKGDAPDGTACGSDGDPCSLDACHAGACEHDALPTGSLCADGDACTVGERCDVDGVCGGGADVCEPPPINDPGEDPDAGIVETSPDAGEASVDDPADDPSDDVDGDGVLPGVDGEVGGGGLGGCAAGGQGAGAGASMIALAFAAVLSRRRRGLAVSAAVSTAVAASAVAAPAAAQSIDATVYKPAAPGSGGFAAEDASVLPAGEVDVGVWLDVARDLLVVRDPDSGAIVDGGRLLASRTTMHVGATFGLPAGFQIATSLPIVTSQRGDAMSGGGELGDLALTATWQAFGGARLGGAVALDAEVPLGDGGFAHDAGPVGGARIIVGGRAGRVAWSLAAGRRWREPQMLGDLIVDDAWVATGGARVEVLDRRMWLVADVYGQHAAGGHGQGDPAEALAGARVRVAGPWVAQAGVGVGLTHGYGAPGLRGVALLAWAPDRTPRPRLHAAAYTPPPPPAPAPAPAPIEPATRDHDALVDHDAVACVDTGCAVPDPTPPELVIERIVLDDRILFDTDRARVKRAGRRALGATLARWQASPDWDRIVLEGHADDRGDDAWNEELGRLRAERVRDALIELGAPADRITVVSHGKRRPRAEGRSERARAENRRVELVVLRAAP